jgi:PAS domain S-box-containing protein
MPAELPQQRGESPSTLDEVQRWIAIHPAMLFLVDRNGVTLAASPRAAEILGYPLAELVGGPVAEIFHPEDRLAVGIQLTRCFADPGQVHEWEFRKLRRDGSIVWVREAARALTLADGLPAALVSCHDITSHHRLEDDLSATRHRLEELVDEKATELRTILECSPDFIQLLDRAARIVYINRVRPEWAGKKVVGTLTYDYLEEPFRSRMREALERVFRSGEPVSYEVEYRLPDRSMRFFESRIAPVVLHGEVVGAVCHATDVTDRRLAEAGWRESEERLQRATRLDSIGRLAGGIAHDFNNLLTVVTGSAQLVGRSFAGLDPRRRQVEEILSAVERANGLTKQLLAFASRQTLAPRIVDPGAVIRDVESLLRRLIRADIRLEIRLDPQVRSVRADPSQLEQVVLNLVINACDAIRGPGRVEIATFGREADEAPAGEDALRPGPYSGVRVTDNGSGIPLEIQGRIFEPFFTTKPSGSGTGLGLATAYGIVRQSGGKISFHSEPGRGTTFEVLLPVAQEDDGGAAFELAPARPLAGTVLLVEDDDAVRDLSRHILEREGFRVIEATHGEEALRRSAEEAGPIDLLLTDVVMPGISGREVAAEIGRTRPRTAILLMSGYAGPPADTPDPWPLLSKPFTLDALLAAVRAQIETQRSRS